jgi:hypothetical protein
MSLAEKGISKYRQYESLHLQEERSSCRLEPAWATVLAVNIAEAFLLLAVLEEAGSGKDQDAANACHAKDSGENIVNEDVGVGANRNGAAAHQGSGSRRWAGSIGNEGRRR